LTSLIDQRRDLVSDLIDAAKNNDEKKAQKNAAKQDALSDQGNAIAREIGATSCAGD
jgi:hypothetical protein